MFVYFFPVILKSFLLGFDFKNKCGDTKPKRYGQKNGLECRAGGNMLGKKTFGNFFVTKVNAYWNS